MARVRASSAGAGWAIATVVFGFGFIVALVLAIVFGSQIAGAREEADQLGEELQSYVRQSEKGKEQVATALSHARDKRVSLVGLLLDENRTLKRKIVDDSALDEVLRRIELAKVGDGQTLVGEINRLTAELEAANKRDQVKQKQLLEANDLKIAEVNVRAQLTEEFNTSAEDIKETLRKIQKSNEIFRVDTENQVGRLERHLEQVRSKKDDRISRLESELAQKKVEIQQLRDIVRTRERRSVQSAEPQNLRDGTVVRLANERDLIYIDLSRSEHVKLGMTFEVFEQDTVIKADDEQRGKATIEIIRVLDAGSVARVVRLEPTAVVNVGDQIANIAYDRYSQYLFFVHGLFDIESTGRTTMTDNRRIRNMISRWGGTISDEITFQTDYLVLGIPPVLPEQPPENSRLELWERYQEKLRIYKDFQSLLGAAEKLRIPVLNQNRFLNLVGYYRR